MGDDYEAVEPTLLTFTDNTLTISNDINSTDTDKVSFVLLAGYEMSNLSVTNFTGTGTITYTLSRDGADDITGTFDESNASGFNLLAGNPLIANTNITYTFTFTTTAEETLSYTIEGISAPFNFVTTNYTVEQLLGFGFTMQQLIDGGFWNTDPSANRFNSSYMTDYLDVSGGNVIVRGNIIMDTGDVKLNSFTYADPYIFSADISLNNRLFVAGDVSMGDASFNIVGDISINGILSLGSYKDESISLNAIASEGAGGYSTANSITTITEDFAYSDNIQFNGDILLNAMLDPTLNEPNVFASTDDKTPTPTEGPAVSNWQWLDMSTTGQYMVAVAGGNPGGIPYPGNVWLSTNYGENWTEKQVGGSVRLWWWAQISGDGSKIMVMGTETNNTYFNNKFIWRSIDSGENWAVVDWIVADEPTYSNAAIQPMLMDTTGNRICWVTMTNNQNANREYDLVLSNDGGNNWNRVTGTSKRIQYYDMSKSGQYIVVIYADGSTKPRYSADFGETFITLTNGTVGNNAYNLGNFNGRVTISNTGKICYVIDVGDPLTLYNIDVTTGTVTGTKPNQENNAANVAVEPGITQFSNETWSLNSSNDGKYILYYGYESSGTTTERHSVGLLSSNYGASFTNIDPESPLYVVGAADKRKFGVCFSNDNRYVSVAAQDKIYIYHNTKYVTNPVPITTYFGPTTTLKLSQVGSAIQFADGTSISSSNIYSGSFKTNDVVFKASTFNNMTVVGDFASNPQLTPSDYRIKTNVQDLNETHILDNLRPVRYLQTQTGKHDIGFLAHELQKYYPELVDGEKDGDIMQSVNYNGLLAVLIHEIQQLKTRVANRRARSLVA